LVPRASSPRAGTDAERPQYRSSAVRDSIQFTKAPYVLRGMGLAHLAKNGHAKKELAEKGMAVG
jgi:hypothetical protein